MDPSKFNSESPGRLTKIPTFWGDRDAFIPDPLPPQWEFCRALWPLLAEAKQQIGILEGLGSSLPNPGILLRTVTDREAIRSSRLEGTYASPRELLLFELEPRESTSKSDPANDHREVFNYRMAIQHGTTTDLPLSLRLLRELHGVLMNKVRGNEKNPGEFRSVPVGIGVDGRFIPPPPASVMQCLDSLEKYMNQDATPFDKLVDCFLVHYQFETIHPFNDGNGRIGRVLLALMLQQKCGFSKPWLYMSEFFEQHREEYFQKLFNVSAKADWSSWTRFCLEGTVHQAKDTIGRCRVLLKTREEFRSRLSNSGEGSIRLGQILDDIFHTPFIRVADLAKRLNVTYPTAKKDLERLNELGMLHELPDIYPKTYYAPDVFKIAYEKLDD